MEDIKKDHDGMTADEIAGVHRLAHALMLNDQFVELHRVVASRIGDKIMLLTGGDINAAIDTISGISLHYIMQAAAKRPEWFAKWDAVLEYSDTEEQAPGALDTFLDAITKTLTPKTLPCEEGYEAPAYDGGDIPSELEEIIKAANAAGYDIGVLRI